MELDEQGKQLKHYLVVAAILHALLFSTFFVGSLFTAKPLVFQPTIMVDMVALPSQVKNADAPPPDLSLPVKPNTPPPEEKPPEPEEKTAKPEPDEMKAPEKPAEDEMALEKKKAADAKKRAAEALKRIREEAKKERLADEAKKKAALDKRKADLKAFEQKYRDAQRGNQLNQGTSITGQMQATLNAYVGSVTEEIRSHWALPSYLQNQNYKASIVIHLGPRGNVERMEFTRTSGNSGFDNNAEGAIRQSKFFPPPAEMANALRNSGIEVKFPL
jgi:colicin import membrane protein